MQERRKLDRKVLTVYSRVMDRGSGRALGYLVDLSLNGAMLVSEEPLLENTIFNLRFDLPAHPLFSVDHLDMPARVAWCSPDADPAFSIIGFEFLSVNHQESDLLAEMIKVYKLNRNPLDDPSMTTQP